MQITAQEQALSAARVALGPGMLLRQAREAAGLEREDVATRTRLDAKLIAALESEDYARLPQAAFVKGYIRSIAKELSCDAAPILAQYAEQVQAEDPRIADFASRAPAQITSSSALVRGVSYGIIASVIVLVAVWWHHNYEDFGQSPAGTEEFAAEGAAAPVEPAIPLSYSYTIVEHATNPLGPVESWRRQTDGSAPPAEPAPALEPEANTTPATGAAASATPASAAPATGEVVLAASGESWVEISDMAGKRLYFGLIKPGNRVGVTGKAPYDLVIGNSPAVELSFRGSAIDLKRHAINGVARLSLGEIQ